MMAASIIFSCVGTKLNAVSDNETNSLIDKTSNAKPNAVFPVFLMLTGIVFSAPKANFSFMEPGLMLKSLFTSSAPPPPPPAAAAPPPPPAAPLGHAELLHELLQQKPPSHWFAEVHGCPSANKSVWRNPILLVYDGELIMLLIVPTTFIIL